MVTSRRHSFATDIQPVSELPLSLDHLNRQDCISVAQGFRRSFNELADSKESQIREAGYEYIPIDVHVPILDVPRLPQTLADKVLSKAVIQGSFNMDRRDYAHLFDDLKVSLAGD